MVGGWALIGMAGAVYFGMRSAALGAGKSSLRPQDADLLNGLLNMARAVALILGEPLAPLPPGALTLRGSRARATRPVDVALDAEVGPARHSMVDEDEDGGTNAGRREDADSDATKGRETVVRRSGAA